MANQISVSPAELRQRGGKFISGGQQIENVIKSLNNEANALQTVWKGEAQAKFDAKYKELSPKMKEFIALVDSIGKQLKSVADAMEKSDQDIARQISRQEIQREVTGC